MDNKIEVFKNEQLCARQVQIVHPSASTVQRET